MGDRIRFQRGDLLPEAIDHDAPPGVRNTNQGESLFHRTKARRRDKLGVDDIVRDPTIIREIDQRDALRVATIRHDPRKEHFKTENRRKRKLAPQGSGVRCLLDLGSPRGFPNDLCQQSASPERTARFDERYRANLVDRITLADPWAPPEGGVSIAIGSAPDDFADEAHHDRRAPIVHVALEPTAKVVLGRDG